MAYTQLTQKGAGSLNVFARDLSNGIYNYVLVIDGKTIVAKKWSGNNNSSYNKKRPEFL